MATISAISAGVNIGKKLAVWAVPLVTFALGILFGSKGCYDKTTVRVEYDTLVIDTSKIIEHTPIIVKNVQLFIRDTASCESALPPYAINDGDTLSIGRINSCKGILENIRLVKKPDTVTISDVRIFTRHDTVTQSLLLPVLKIFDYGVSLKVGTGLGVKAGIGCDASFYFGRWGITIQPSLYYVDKARAWVFGGLSYKILGN